MSRLGESTRGRASRAQATRVVARELPRRPDVVDEGVVLEVVWYAHRDAAPLLPADYPAIDSTRQVTLSRRAIRRGSRDLRQVEC